MVQRRTAAEQQQRHQDHGSVRRNRSILLSEEMLFMFGSGLLDARTVLPAFVTSYSSSLVLIALLPAIRSGGQLLPQLFAAHLMREHARKKPWLLGAALVSRLPIAVTPALLFVAPHTPAVVVLTVFYLALLLFSVADSFAGLAWYDIMGKAIPRAERPWLLGGLMLGGSMGGLAAGLLVTALVDSPRWPFPRNYAVLFALAFAALAVGSTLLVGLVEPAGNTASPAATRRGTLDQLYHLLGDGGPFARLMRVQLLLGVPALAAGLYTPYALGELKLPLDVTGIFVAATAVGAGMGGLCLPLVAHRWGSQDVLAVAAVSIILAPLAIAVAGVFPAILWVREVWSTASFVAQGLAMTGLFMGISDLVLAMAPPDETPLYIGLSNTVAGVLVPLPLLGGVLAQWFGSAAVLWLCPLPAVAGLVALRGVRAHVAPAAAGSAVPTDHNVSGAPARTTAPSHPERPYADAALGAAGGSSLASCPPSLGDTSGERDAR